MATTLAPPARTASTENFPVGSWLIAAERRPVVAAYYRVARAADDIADNHGFDVAEKLRRLDTIDANLTGRIHDDPDAVALREMFLARNLTLEHVRHLLQAFKADAANRQCRSWSDLLAYCRYSAAPVGRFLLELHGESKNAWPASDALCSALQILNHLQDCQADWHHLRRLYIPSDWLRDAGLTTNALLEPGTSPALRRVINRVLDGVNQLNLTAAMLPRQISDRRLRMEATAIIFISRRLAARLRKRDPIAFRVELPGIEKAAALVWGAVRGFRA